MISPDFQVGGPNAGRAWASGASEKLYKKTKADLEAIFENIPELERKYDKARVLSCGGIGAQWFAQTATCHLTQLPDDDMCSAIQFRLGSDTFCADICPRINSDGVECGSQCDREGRHLLTCPSGGHVNKCSMIL